MHLIIIISSSSSNAAEVTIAAVRCHRRLNETEINNNLAIDRR